MKDFSPLALTSAVVGFPADIGIITRKDGTVIRFSGTDEPIVVTPDTFPVVPGLAVSAVKHTINGEMPSCEIVGDYGAGKTFDSEELDIGLFDGADVQIYTVDRMNLSRKGLKFTGSISTMTLDPINRLVLFSVKGPATAAKTIMTQKRAPMCRTDWGSSLCGVNPASYAVSATVATIESAFVFTVSGLVQPTGYFNNGEAVTSNNVAFELGSWVNSTQTFTAYLPCYRIVSVGMVITLYPGCDKTLTGANGCKSFSNQINFQGEPHFLGTAAAAQQV